MSKKIRDYIKAEHSDIQIITCCTTMWKVKIYEDAMPEGVLSDEWKAMPHTAEFKAGDEIYSLCHNCTNIAEEQHPGVIARSLYELLDADENFAFPDISGMNVTVQDYWRSSERADEQKAVRSLLSKMHISYIETEKNHAETDFCGNSLYKPQVARNPKHYAENIEGLLLSLLP